MCMSIESQTVYHYYLKSMDKNLNGELLNESNISRFPFKLWKLINKPNKYVIAWGNEGRTILVNYVTLENYLKSDVSTFKTKNIASFVRQLNLYGFQKVPTQLRDAVCNSKNPHMHEFRHEYFQARRPDLIHRINRSDGGVRKQKYYKNASPHLQACRLALTVALERARKEFIHTIPISDPVNKNTNYINSYVPERKKLSVTNYAEYFVPRDVETPFHEVPISVHLEVKEMIQSSDITSCFDPQNTRDQNEKTFYSSIDNNRTENNAVVWKITTERRTHIKPGQWFNILSPQSVRVESSQPKLSEVISNTIERMND